MTAPTTAGRGRPRGESDARQLLIAAARAQDGFETLMRTYYRIMAPNPGLPRLIQRVLHDDPQTESYRILQSILEEVLTVSLGWLQSMLIDSGHMRKDIDPKLARMSFVSLLVFPLVAPPLLIRSSGLSMSEADIDRLVTHNVDILQRSLLRHTESERAS